MIYLKLRNSFVFLWNINDLKEKADNLLNMYYSDLDFTFLEECLYRQEFLKENKKMYKEQNMNLKSK